MRKKKPDKTAKRNADELLGKYIETITEIQSSGEAVLPIKSVRTQGAIPFLNKDPGTRTVWLHWNVEIEWDAFTQWSRSRAWTTDSREGGNPVVVRKLTVSIEWFDCDPFGGGHRSENSSADNTSSVSSATKSCSTFPFPLSPDQACCMAWCEGPDGTGPRVCANP